MKTSKTISEFKDFIAKGNVMDMAVGVIIGGVFGKIVTSLVNDIFSKWYFNANHRSFNWWTWFYGLKIQVGTATITYGNFIQNVVDFLIVAACIFTMLKFLAHFKKTTNDQLDQKESKKDDTVVLLEEIRDLLKKIDKVK